MIGTDIIEIERIKKSIESDRFIERVYTMLEQSYLKTCALPHESAAAMFCAKEAVAKALGTGIAEGITLKDIEILHHKNGKPYAVLYGAAQQKLTELNFTSAEISLSHCQDYATAVCILR